MPFHRTFLLLYLLVSASAKPYVAEPKVKVTKAMPAAVKVAAASSSKTKKSKPKKIGKGRARAGSNSSSTSLATIRTAVQQILDEEAVTWNASFTAGFSSDDHGSFGVAAGLADAAAGPGSPAMAPNTMIPVGSATKAYTAATIVQLVDRGALQLDDPMHQYVDPVLRRLNATDLLTLWKGDATIQDVTVRHLLHMSSGIHDYDDAALQKFTHDYPGEDKTGVDMLHELDKTFQFRPGKGGAYTSVGYVLLGFVAVGASSSMQGGTWNDFDQRSFMSGDQRMMWNRTSFPKMGRCTDYDVPKQWSARQVGTEAVYYDLGQASCLNGWTCGNAAVSAENLATFFHVLVGKAGTNEGIVSAEGLRNMTTFDPLTTGFAPGMPYGLGLMELYDTWPTEISDYAWIGHAGQDYASSCPLCGYNTKYKFGVAVAVNFLHGMNCSSTAAIQKQGNAPQHAQCRVHNAIVSLLSNGKAPKLPCGDDAHLREHQHATNPASPSLWHLAQTGIAQRWSSVTVVAETMAHQGQEQRQEHRQEQQAADVGETGTCKGIPIAVIPYVTDGKCHAVSPQYGGFFYTSVVGNTRTSVNLTQWSSSDKTCQGPPTKPSSIVPLGDCFRVPTPTPGKSMDIYFVYNATSGIVDELVWSVVDIKSCAWWDEGIPGSAPSPSPTPPGPSSKELLVQSYDSMGCEASSGSGSWVPVQTGVCQHNIQGFFEITCAGYNLTVVGGCNDAQCDVGCQQETVGLGDCIRFGNTSARFILMGGKQC